MLLHCLHPYSIIYVTLCISFLYIFTLLNYMYYIHFPIYVSLLYYVRYIIPPTFVCYIYLFHLRCFIIKAQICDSSVSARWVVVLVRLGPEYISPQGSGFEPPTAAGYVRTYKLFFFFFFFYFFFSLFNFFFQRYIAI